MYFIYRVNYVSDEGNSEYFPFVYKKNSNKCFFTELL